MVPWGVVVGSRKVAIQQRETVTFAAVFAGTIPWARPAEPIFAGFFGANFGIIFSGEKAFFRQAKVASLALLVI